jgi:hypothetical protein
MPTMNDDNNDALLEEITDLRKETDALHGMVTDLDAMEGEMEMLREENDERQEGLDEMVLDEMVELEDEANEFREEEM